MTSPYARQLSRRTLLAGGLGLGLGSSVTLPAPAATPTAQPVPIRPPAWTKPKPLDPIVLSTFNNNEMVARLIGSPNTKSFYNFPSIYREDPYVGVRDPAVAQFRGQYWLAYTRADRFDYLGFSNTWGLAASSGLSGFRRVAVLPTFDWVTRCWAPDLTVVNDRMYAYLSLASSSGRFSIWVASTADGLTWTTPREIPGLGNAIDACVRPDSDGGYVGVMKDETTKRLAVIRGTDPMDLLRTTAVPTGDRWVEGPALLRLSDRWRLFVDFYVDSEVAYLDSPDLRTWGPVERITYPDRNLRHVSALTVAELPERVKPGFGWRGVELRNGWRAGDPLHGDPQFRQDDNVVRLRGTVAPGGGSGQVAFTVPPPQSTTEWAVTGIGGGGERLRGNLSITRLGEARVFYRGGVPSRGVIVTGTYRID